MTTNPQSEAGKLRRIEHNPDGVTTEFEVPFRWLNDDDVIVKLIETDGTVDDWVRDVDYTLTPNQIPVTDSGGVITALAGAPTGQKLLIWAETERTQETKYKDAGDFPSQSHEDALDKRALLEQEDARDLGRALRAPDTDIGQLNDIPDAASRANQALVFDGAGQPAAGGISQKGDLLTSAYGEGLVLVANANAGRSYLSAASAADITQLNNKIDAIAVVGAIRARIDEADLTPTFIPLDGRTIGKTGSGATTENDGLRALFDLAKVVPNTGNSGSEDFDAGDTVLLADLRGRTIIGTGQGTGLTLRNLGDVLGTEANSPTTVQAGTGTNVGDIVADSNMQPSWAGPWEVYSGVLPSLEEINGGQLGILWNEGGWAAAVDFKRNDALRYGSGTQGRSYVCLLDHTSSATDEPGVGPNWQTYWAIMNYDGEAGGVGNWRGAWSALTPYAINDAVQHNGSSWIANAGSTGSEPGVGAEWDLQAAKGEDGDPGAPGEVQAVAVQDGRHLWLGTVGGTADDLTATANPTLTAYTVGQVVRWAVASANTGAKMTLNIDGVQAVALTDRFGADPAANTYLPGMIGEAVYTGTGWADLNINRKPQVFNYATPGSFQYQPGIGVRLIEYEVTGGGGGGRGGTSGAAWPGGSAAGTAYGTLDVSDGNPVSITVGAGGAGGAGGSDGSDGAASSLGSITSPGGIGGTQTGVPNGTTPTGGDLNIAGGDAGEGYGTPIERGGDGGESQFGPGGRGRRQSSGTDGKGYGSGGAGAGHGGSNSGGDGAPGLVRVREIW